MAVTFEDVRKMQRKEKASARLCELPVAYLVELSDAIKESTKLYKDNQDAGRLRDMENMIKLSREVFDMREQKILLKALRAVRTGEADDASMTAQEKAFYIELVDGLRKQRKIVDTVLVGEFSQSKPVEASAADHTLLKEADPNIILVRVSQSIPKFVGSDSVEYGPFNSMDVVKLPKKEALLLSEQNLVETL